jgi:hypothetical protein
VLELLVRDPQNLCRGCLRLRFETAERHGTTPRLWQLREKRGDQLAQFPRDDSVFGRAVRRRHHVLKAQHLVGLPVLDQQLVIAFTRFVQLDGQPALKRDTSPFLHLTACDFRLKQFQGNLVEPLQRFEPGRTLCKPLARARERLVDNIVDRRIVCSKITPGLEIREFPLQCWSDASSGRTVSPNNADLVSARSAITVFSSRRPTRRSLRRQASS